MIYEISGTELIFLFDAKWNYAARESTDNGLVENYWIEMKTKTRLFAVSNFCLFVHRNFFSLVRIVEISNKIKEKLKKIIFEMLGISIEISNITNSHVASVQVVLFAYCCTRFWVLTI